jgi:hypothetical protein
VTNRIAIVKGSGPFASIANPVAAQNPSAILIVTSIESATAVVVVGGVPTFTISPAEADILLDRLTNTDDDTLDPANGAVSRLPLRIADTISLPAFPGAMAGFSSRGPNDHPNARFRVIKPDVTGPGVGIFGAATPDGLPDDTVGLASTTGYTTANGTSFSGPVTAGGITLVRQRVREMLNLDSVNLNDPQYRAKRFDSVIVSRALLQNSATNLRSGTGVPQGDGNASVASINDMGSGFINIAGALAANAIMVSPTALLTTPEEYSTSTPPATPLEVMLPTASFGEVPVVNVNGIVTRTRKVIIRSVGQGGAGGGTYNLTVQNNRVPAVGFGISFLAADGVTPTTSVNVPSGGTAEFFVRVDANGSQITVSPTEVQWYITATGNGQSLRMPFYFRAVAATVPNITSPTQTAPQGTEGMPSGGCATDTNGNYTLGFNYTRPSTGPAPVGFRVQEGTRSDSVFFDDANEPLVGGANSKWTGSAQWNTQVNPTTGSPAYFIPDAANQNESLTMVNSVALPPGGATLSFDTNQDTEQDFDFANVDISADGVNFTTVASFSGTFVGRRFINISGYAGQSIKVRFRLTSDLAVPAPGWYVENIRVSSDDFRTIADLGSAATSFPISARANGTYTYRVAGLFNNTGGEPTVTGPYSNLQCVTVAQPLVLSGAVSRKVHNGVTYDVPLPATGSIGIEPRTGGTSGNHQVVFSFPAAVNSTGYTATASSETGGSGVVSSTTASGNEITVNLTGVTDVQRLRIDLSGVTSGATSGNVGVTMGLLTGDTIANGFVNASDVGAAKSQSGLPTTSQNFRADVTVNGVINSSDLGLIKSKSGSVLP